jgi:FkbM family methyltransferase
MFPSARIVALEVEASNYAMLKKNVEAYKNIIPLNKGLWSKRAWLRVSNPGADKWSFSVVEAPTEENSVEGVGVSDLLNDFREEAVDFLKCDIEGAEKEILSQSAEGWIGKVSVIAAELHDRFTPGCSEALENATRGMNFRAHRDGEYWVLVRAHN